MEVTSTITNMGHFTTKTIIHTQTPYTSGIADEIFFYTVTEKKFSTHIVAVKLTINMGDFTIKSLYTQEERRR